MQKTIFPTKDKKKKIQRSYSITDIENWKFEEQEFPKEWMNHLGALPDRFFIYIDGDGGHGKTEYVLKMSKMIAMFMGKARLNNVEQGKHVQIQESVLRNNFKRDIPPGKFQYDSIRNFDDYYARLKRPNSGIFHIIDSISYWPLNQQQIQKLINDFKKKSFIFVAYKKHRNQNKEIMHLCDIKIEVENFVAKTNGTSRFGGNEDFIVWDKKVKKDPQTSLDV